MKIASAYVALVLACFGPTPLFAQQLESWLSNVKREVSRLGINERGYLHSVNRLRNSVIQDENLFFVSSMQFEELDIQLLPDGNVQVSRDWKKSSQSVKPGPRRKASGLAVKSCGNLSGNISEV